MLGLITTNVVFRYFKMGSTTKQNICTYANLQTPTYTYTLFTNISKNQVTHCQIKLNLLLRLKKVALH